MEDRQRLESYCQDLQISFDDLTSSSIASGQFEDERLLHLNLTDHAIDFHKFPIPTFRHLEKLYIKITGAEIAPNLFEGLDHLNDLHCYFDHFEAKELPESLFLGLHHLKVLRLENHDGTVIEYLPTSIFSDQRRLQNLNLSYHWLIAIQNGLLNNMTQLQVLDVSHNFKPLYLGSKALEGINLADIKRVNLRGNKLPNYLDKHFFDFSMIEIFKSKLASIDPEKASEWGKLGRGIILQRELRPLLPFFPWDFIWMDGFGNLDNIEDFFEKQHLADIYSLPDCLERYSKDNPRIDKDIELHLSHYHYSPRKIFPESTIQRSSLTDIQSPPSMIAPEIHSLIRKLLHLLNVNSSIEFKTVFDMLKISDLTILDEYIQQNPDIGITIDYSKKIILLNHQSQIPENLIYRCSICKRDIIVDAGKELTSCIYCKNIFHYDHFYAWIQSRGACVVCKRQITLNDILKLS